MAILTQNGGSGRSDTIFDMVHMLGQGSDTFADKLTQFSVLLWTVQSASGQTSSAFDEISYDVLIEIRMRNQTKQAATASYATNCC